MICLKLSLSLYADRNIGRIIALYRLYQLLSILILLTLFFVGETMSVMLLLCLIMWTLQIISQDRRVGYVDELCAHADLYAQQGHFDLALHNCDIAMRFYTKHNLQNNTVLCKILMQLGAVYYTRWLEDKAVGDLSGASDNLKKAMYLGHVPAIEAFGVLSMQCGNAHEAIDYFNKAAQEGSNKSLNYRCMAICFHQIGNDSDAVKYFWKAHSHGDKESINLLRSLPRREFLQ